MLRGLTTFLVAVCFVFASSSAFAKPVEKKVSWIHRPGEIIIRVKERKLYYIHKRGRALVYPIATPKHRKDVIYGRTKITQKRPKPTWTPTPDMRKKNPKLPQSVKGGTRANPLGSYALNLGFPYIRIHGNNKPKSIGTADSAGCYRMYNKDVVHLAKRVKVGTKVIVKR